MSTPTIIFYVVIIGLLYRACDLLYRACEEIAALKRTVAGAVEEMRVDLEAIETGVSLIRR